MVHKIKSVKPLDHFVILVVFLNGIEKHMICVNCIRYFHSLKNLRK